MDMEYTKERDVDLSGWWIGRYAGKRIGKGAAEKVLARNVRRSHVYP